MNRESSIKIYILSCVKYIPRRRGFIKEGAQPGLYDDLAWWDRGEEGGLRRRWYVCALSRSIVSSSFRPQGL